MALFRNGWISVGAAVSSLLGATLNGQIPDAPDRARISALTPLTQCPASPISKELNGGGVEVKGAYFFFVGAQMRKVYDQGGWDLQISGAYPIRRWLAIYASAEYLQASGTSTSGHERTTIRQVPLSLGLKPMISIGPRAKYYISAGPRYFFVYSNTDSSRVASSTHHNGLGGFLHTGFNLFPRRYLLVDLFAEVSYFRMKGPSTDLPSYGKEIQVGAVSFGAGLGYAF